MPSAISTLQKTKIARTADRRGEPDIAHVAVLYTIYSIIADEICVAWHELATQFFFSLLHYVC